MSFFSRTNPPAVEQALETFRANFNALENNDGLQFIRCLESELVFLDALNQTDDKRLTDVMRRVKAKLNSNKSATLETLEKARELLRRKQIAEANLEQAENNLASAIAANCARVN